MAQKVKNPPAMQETWVQSLGWEDPLEGEMATHSSILAQRIPWSEEPGGYSPQGRKESDMTEQQSTAPEGRWVKQRMLLLPFDLSFFSSKKH